MEALPGKDIMVTFMEVDEEGGRLVLSARKRVDKSGKGLKARGWPCASLSGHLMAVQEVAAAAASHSLADALPGLARGEHVVAALGA